MCMGESAAVAGVALNFADLNHLGIESGFKGEGLIVSRERSPSVN